MARVCDCDRWNDAGGFRPGVDCMACHLWHTDAGYRRDHGGDGAAVPPRKPSPPPRRVCASLDMDAYPFERFPAERFRPCPQKTRRCLLYDEDVTLDPRPAGGSQGPVLRDCRGCEQRGEGFAPRGGPAT